MVEETFLTSGNFNKGQRPFDIEKPFEKDRNHKQGGRSFYFFDFDENIVYLNTATVIFHKKTNQELYLTSKEFSAFHEQIGIKGRYKDFKIVFNDTEGSFRNYRDRKLAKIFKFFGKKQTFINDIKLTLARGNNDWQGPSWDCFYHAVYNQRPISLITARGHSPETVKLGIEEFVKAGHLPCQPNYLSILPVNYPEIKSELLANEPYVNVAQLKKYAIKRAFTKAIKLYGDKPHRFGMSDDDKNNIKLITQAMQELKRVNPHISFFVIETSEGNFLKKEIHISTESKLLPKVNPLNLRHKNTIGQLLDI